MHVTVGHATVSWTTPPTRETSAAAASRPDIYPRRHTAPVARVPISPFARMQRRAAGKVGALAGSFNILVGTAFADRPRTVRGHRQRVVGMLQFNCEVDRQTANAFVERWLAKSVTPAR